MLIAAPAVARADGAIASVSAHLYYHGSATLESRDLLATQTLWNTIIGEGDAAEPSGTTLFKVVLSGVAELTGGKVELVARAGKKVVSKQRVALDDYVTEKGKTVTVPFLVYGTGCEPLAVSFALTGGKRRLDQRQIAIPFACGE